MKRALVLVAALALAASGCGHKKTTVQTGPRGTGLQPTSQLTADAHGRFKFDKKLIEAPAGPVHLVLVNPSSVPHDIAIKGHGVNVKGPIVKNGGRSSVTAVLKPGVYEFYCSVDAHEAAGMKGTLRVGSARTGSGS